VSTILIGPNESGSLQKAIWLYSGVGLWMSEGHSRTHAFFKPQYRVEGEKDSIKNSPNSCTKEEEKLVYEEERGDRDSKGED